MSDEIEVPWKCKRCGKETMYGDYNYCPSCLGVVTIEKLHELDPKGGIQVVGCTPNEHKWLIGANGIHDGKPCMCRARVWSWYTVGQFGVSKPNGKRKVDDESDEREINDRGSAGGSTGVGDTGNSSGGSRDGDGDGDSGGSAAASPDDADGALRRDADVNRVGHDDSDSDGDARPDKHGTGLPWPW